MKIPVLNDDVFDEVAVRAARGFTKPKIEALRKLFVQGKSLSTVSAETEISIVSLRQSCSQFLNSYIKNVYVPVNWKFQSLIIEKSKLKELRCELTRQKEIAFLREARDLTKT